jgi:hypothetical protein
MHDAKIKHDWAIAAHIEAHLLNAWKVKGSTIQPYQLNPMRRRNRQPRERSVVENGMMIIGRPPPWLARGNEENN